MRATTTDNWELKTDNFLFRASLRSDDFFAFRKDFPENPCRSSCKNHSGSCSDQHEGKAFSKEEVHGNPGQSGTDGAGKDIEGFIGPREEPESTHPEAEGHLDGYV